MERLVETTELLTCPFCGHTAPRALFHWYATPPGQYAQPYKCPKCKKIFSPLPLLLDKEASSIV